MSDIKPITNVNTKVINTAAGSKLNIQTQDMDFTSCLEQAQGLDAIFEQAAYKYNVPIELLKAVGKAESNFNPNAVSKAGAQGVMQLMPGTAKELGVNSPFDPEQNIMGGAKYLSGLIKKFDGDIKLSLAAYNAGSGNVRKYGGIPPFKETQNYVVKVMKYMNETFDISTATGMNSQPNTLNRSQTAHLTTTAHIRAASLNSNRIESRELGAGNLEALFTYDDYLRLLELLSRGNIDEEQDGKNNNFRYDAIIRPPYINIYNNYNQN